MFTKIKDFFSRIVSLFRSHPILMIVAVLTVGVFLAPYCLIAYRKARTVPVVGPVLPAK
jgi:hypothetical protein